MDMTFAWGLFAFAMGLGIGLICGMIQIYLVVRKTLVEMSKEYINALHNTKRT